MNNRQRLAYARRILATQDRLSLRFYRIIAAELRRAGKDFADDYLKTYALSPQASAAHTKKITDILDKLASTTGQAFLDIELTPDHPLTMPTYLEQQTIANLQTIAQQSAVGVAQTTIQQAQSVIAASLSNGDTPQQVAKNILSKVGGVASRSRAMTIARTEVGIAANTATYDRTNAAADESGLDIEYEWISTNDGRVRDTHKQANGQRVKRGEDFRVGGDRVRHPSDAKASASNIVNCRCVMGVIVNEV